MYHSIHSLGLFLDNDGRPTNTPVWHLSEVTNTDPNIIFIHELDKLQPADRVYAKQYFERSVYDPLYGFYTNTTNQSLIGSGAAITTVMTKEIINFLDVSPEAVDPNMPVLMFNPTSKGFVYYLFGIILNWLTVKSLVKNVSVNTTIENLLATGQDIYDNNVSVSAKVVPRSQLKLYRDYENSGKKITFNMFMLCSIKDNRQVIETFDLGGYCDTESFIRKITNSDINNVLKVDPNVNRVAEIVISIELDPTKPDGFTTTELKLNYISLVKL